MIRVTAAVSPVPPDLQVQQVPRVQQVHRERQVPRDRQVAKVPRVPAGRMGFKDRRVHRARPVRQAGRRVHRVPQVLQVPQVQQAGLLVLKDFPASGSTPFRLECCAGMMPRRPAK
jgi:hypothetical protein